MRHRAAVTAEQAPHPGEAEAEADMGQVHGDLAGERLGGAAPRALP